MLWASSRPDRAVAKPGIALAWGARGPEFKSRQPDQIPQRVTNERPSSGGFLQSNWSPKLDGGLGTFARVVTTVFRPLNSLGLSPPNKTRQTRQFVPNYMIANGKRLSGRPKNPTTNPTNPA